MNFIVALSSEARPLLERLKLKKRNGCSHFPVFENGIHRLIISGIGRVQAAAATGYLLGQLDGHSQPIINLGVAGHGLLSVGTTFLANRVFHSLEPGIHYPPTILDSNISKSGLQSMDTPEKDYPEPIGYDMEAHAVCSIAYQSTTRELVQVIKVVSDNPSVPLTDLNPKLVTDLLFENLSLIEDVTEGLQDLYRGILPAPNIVTLLAEIKAKFHFTATQTQEVKKLLQQAHALGLGADEIRNLFESSTGTKTMIHTLKQKLEPLRILQ